MVAMPRQQYKLMLDTKLIKQLDDAAENYGRDSGNKVAAEVIELFLAKWEQAEQARFAVINQILQSGVDNSAGNAYNRKATEKRDSKPSGKRD